jgi:hypothetical protein
MMVPRIFWLCLLGVLGFTEIGSAQTFGTKFVCCETENLSCLGGGSYTKYTPTLRDRALTQVDAQLRCGFKSMFWATHSCPASGGCSSSSGGATSPTPVYKWDEAGLYCYQPSPYAKVPNSRCGKAARQLEIKETFCHLTVDGVYKGLLDRGQEDCPVVYNSSAPPPTNYVWNEEYSYCYSQPGFAIVANANCGKASRILQVKENYCWEYIDGTLKGSLSRGQDDCPSAPGSEDNESSNNGGGPVPQPVLPTETPVCSSASMDPDGDGWGWENNASCKAPTGSMPAAVNSGAEVDVTTPAVLPQSGSFSLTIHSNQNNSVNAVVYVKEDGGNYTAVAEQYLTLFPGYNQVTVNLNQTLNTQQAYRLEVRFNENGYSREVYATRVSAR